MPDSLSLNDPDAVRSATDAYFSALQQQRWRCVWVISGDADWTRSQALIQQRARQWSSLWVSDVLPEAIASENQGDVQHVSAQQLPSLLGVEADAVVLDAHDSLDANTLCMSCGYVTAGGALILLMPALNEALNDVHERPHYSSAQLLEYPQDPAQLNAVFAQRVLTMLSESTHVIWQRQAHTVQIPRYSQDSERASRFDSSESTTFIDHPEQALVVESIKRCAQGHAKRPVVIYANRGRGKSTALGMAAFELLQANKRNVVVCAQHAQQVSAVFHAIAHVSGHVNHGHVCVHGAGRVRFATVDEVLNSDESIDCLMIDEAATLSVAHLKELSVRCNRVVYATTVFGYEGTGQGFKQRFLPYLRTQFPQLKEVSIQQPIRWGDGDGLESFIMRACYLAAELPPIQDELKQVVSPHTLCFERLDTQSDWHSDALLSQVYALMLNAHYRTSPRDLQQLLDDRGMRCYALLSAPLTQSNPTDTPVLFALALVKEEGGFDEDIAQAMVQGTRRVKGHLLAQHIVQETGDASLGRLSGARITRIVTHPDVQRQALGSHLLARVRARLLEEQFDYWGTSFGARESLLPFWQHVGMRPFFLGHKKNNRSGEYNCLYVSQLAPDNAPWVDAMTQRFARSLPSLSVLNPDYRVSLLRALLRSISSHLGHEFTECDGSNDRIDERSHIARYVDNHVAYERVFHELRQFSQQCLHQMGAFPELTSADWELLIRLFYLNESIQKVTKQLLYKRKKDCEVALKRILSILLSRQS